MRDAKVDEVPILGIIPSSEFGPEDAWRQWLDVEEDKSFLPMQSSQFDTPLFTRAQVFKSTTRTVTYDPV